MRGDVVAVLDGHPPRTIAVSEAAEMLTTGIHDYRAFLATPRDVIVSMVALREVAAEKLEVLRRSAEAAAR